MSVGNGITISDELLIRTMNDMKHEVYCLREQVKDIDDIRCRLHDLEDYICNIQFDRQEVEKSTHLPLDSSHADRLKEQPARPSCAPSTDPTTSRNQPIPSDHNAGNHTASPTTSAISERMRTGLVDNRDTSEDAATTFEFLALGADHQTSENTDLRHRGSRSASFASVKNCSANFNAALQTGRHHGDALLTLIPPNALSKLKSTGLSLTKSQSDAIIDFALDTLGWQHPVIHFTTFRAQANNYWNNIRESNEAEQNGASGNVVIVNQAWFSLYVSLLSVGVHHMSPLNAEKCELNEG